MIALLDVNVLIAICWPEHTLHSIAVEWFDRRADEGWATCSLTEAGFLRVSANPAVVGDAVRPRESAALLRRLRKVGSHHFLVDDISPVDSASFPLERLTGHRQVTDAHLLAIARRHDASLASFDRGVQVLARGLKGALVEVPAAP
ncbi:MAG: TA system VapC family ribonuclease toxin [Ilumatobacteraceae bacterium]